jgi:hypothetical protein
MPSGLAAGALPDKYESHKAAIALHFAYNQQRPHSSLNYRTPAEFAREWALATSPSACRNTTPPEPPQGQALRAPAAALTRPGYVIEQSIKKAMRRRVLRSVV